VELFTLLFLVGIALVCDLIGFKYRGITYLVLGGILSLYGLAQLATDQVLILQHEACVCDYSISIAGPGTSDFVTVLAVMAVFAITQFLFAINMSTGSGKEEKK
jgi:hypothetical protein